MLGVRDISVKMEGEKIKKRRVLHEMSGDMA